MIACVTRVLNSARGYPAVWAVVLALRPLGIRAATNVTPTDAIPPLRPPLEEIPPTVWESHGATLVIGGLLLALTVAVVVWLAFRPRPVAFIPPVVHARKAVESLKEKPETGLILSELSRVLRGYLAEVFRLPRQEMTTTEFCRSLQAEPKAGNELAESTADFLRQCDERKFSPRPPLTALNAAAETLRLIELGESRFVPTASKPAADASAGNPPPGA